MRRAFLYYLERERAHPYRPFLHYNSWYDIALGALRPERGELPGGDSPAAARRFIKTHGVVLDAMVFDDGWDDPRTLWQFHSGFPARLHAPGRSVPQYHTHLGVWLSPFGGYGEPREQRLEFGRAQGYETNARGFSLAGPKYYAAFKRSCLEMIRNYGVNHFKFDGIAPACTPPGRRRLSSRYRGHAAVDAGAAAGRSEAVHQPHDRLVAVAVLAPLRRFAVAAGRRHGLCRQGHPAAAMAHLPRPGDLSQHRAARRRCSR